MFKFEMVHQRKEGGDWEYRTFECESQDFAIDLANAWLEQNDSEFFGEVYQARIVDTDTKDEVWSAEQQLPFEYLKDKIFGNL